MSVFKQFTSYLLCTICVLCMIACNSKQTPINSLEELSEELQANASHYTEEDWKTTADELELIESDIEQYKEEYTDEELKEIGRLKGICLVQFTKYSIKSFQNGLEDAMKEMEGIMEGFTQGLKDIDEE